MGPKDILPFTKLVTGDVNFCVEKLNGNDDFDFWARAYIRSLSAMIEGSLTTYSDIIAGLHRSGEVELSLECQLLFNRLDWSIKGTGKVSIQKKKIPSIPYFKAVLKGLAETVPEYTPDLSGAGWESIQSFYSTRNGMLHPKSPEDLHMNKERIKEIEVGRRWFINELQSINNAFLAWSKS